MQNPLAAGFYYDRPRDGTPEFIKARISVKVEDAIATLNAYKNEKGYVNLELLEKKDGSGHYLQVNTYGLEPKPVERTEPDESWRVPNTNIKYPETPQEQPETIKPEDIPF